MLPATSSWGASLTPGSKAVSIFRQVFVSPFLTLWHATRNFFRGSFASFFTETIPGIFTGAWKAVVGLFRRVFISPFITAWHATRDFFRGSFVRFFTDTIPGIFTGAWEKAIGIFRRFFVGPFFAIWHATRDFFQDDFVAFFTQTIPTIFRNAWEFIRRLFVAAANGIIGVMNGFIRADREDTDTESNRGHCLRKRRGLSAVPYPTFSVSTRLPSAATSVTTYTDSHHPGQPTQASKPPPAGVAWAIQARPGAQAPPTTNYSLAARRL